MPRILIPAWVNRSATVFLTIFFILGLSGFFWVAFIWFCLGSSVVEHQDDEMDEMEEDQNEEELSVVDTIIEGFQREKDITWDYQSFLEVFDMQLVESFIEPDFDTPENLDALIWSLNFYKKQLAEKKAVKT